MAPERVQKFASGTWADEQRKLGRAILIMGPSGRIFHADPEIAAWLGRDELGDNGFDLVPPEMAAQGARAMNEHKDLDAFTVWFPMIHRDGSEQWFRWDGRRIEGMLVDAVSPELDPSRHHVHVIAR